MVSLVLMASPTPTTSIQTDLQFISAHLAIVFKNTSWADIVHGSEQLHSDQEVKAMASERGRVGGFGLPRKYSLAAFNITMMVEFFVLGLVAFLSPQIST
jgi:hypothetical protein